MRELILNLPSIGAKEFVAMALLFLLGNCYGELRLGQGDRGAIADALAGNAARGGANLVTAYERAHAAALHGDSAWFVHLLGIVVYSILTFGLAAAMVALGQVSVVRSLTLMFFVAGIFACTLILPRDLIALSAMRYTSWICGGLFGSIAKAELGRFRRLLMQVTVIGLLILMLCAFAAGIYALHETLYSKTIDLVVAAGLDYRVLRTYDELASSLGRSAGRAALEIMLTTAFFSLAYFVLFALCYLLLKLFSTALRLIGKGAVATRLMARPLLAIGLVGGGTLGALCVIEALA